MLRHFAGNSLLILIILSPLLDLRLECAVDLVNLCIELEQCLFHFYLVTLHSLLIFLEIIAQSQFFFFILYVQFEVLLSKYVSDQI